MNVCLFGGSFDPVHEGHRMIASRAVEFCGVDRVVFLPCTRSPLKDAEPFLSDAERLQLLRLTLENDPWAQIDTLDLTMPPPSWTWRLVSEWEKRNAGHNLFWLMGEDQWKAFDKWARIDYLMQKLTFIVHCRNGEVPKPRLNARALFLEGDHPASSSEIRACIKAGKPIPYGWMNSEAEKALREIVSC